MEKPAFRLWEKTVLSILLVVLVGLLWLFISVALADCPTWIRSYLGLTDKNEALKFLGISMGGVLLALQALIANRRAKAMEDTARAQVEANNNTEQGQRQERLKNAIEHLGHDNASVRLGGAYELFHLAEDTAEDTKDLRQTVLDILCAHIRRTTGEDEYQKRHPSKPSEEVQSLLTLLFMQEHGVFKGLHINLQGSWLNGANLNRAGLEGAILTRVHLRGAYLEDARLQEVDLTKAFLQGAHLRRTFLQGAHMEGASLQWADLREASLQGAKLVGVSLQRAFLWGASLQGAHLQHASLQGANLWRASLQGVDLEEALLQGANLLGAALQGANLLEALLQGANLRRASLQGAYLGSVSLQGVVSQNSADNGPFAEDIRARIDQEADLSEVIFVGGLSREDIDSIVKNLSDKKAKYLREKLETHIDRPVSHELPENSDAITGTYTAEEAEQWIAEYDKAMSEVPTENDN